MSMPMGRRVVPITIGAAPQRSATENEGMGDERTLTETELGLPFAVVSLLLPRVCSVHRARIQLGHKRHTKTLRDIVQA